MVKQNQSSSYTLGELTYPNKQTSSNVHHSLQYKEKHAKAPKPKIHCISIQNITNPWKINIAIKANLLRSSPFIEHNFQHLIVKCLSSHFLLYFLSWLVPLPLAPSASSLELGIISVRARIAPQASKNLFFNFSSISPTAPASATAFKAPRVGF